MLFHKRSCSLPASCSVSQGPRLPQLAKQRLWPFIPVVHSSRCCIAAPVNQSHHEHKLTAHGSHICDATLHDLARCIRRYLSRHKHLTSSFDGLCVRSGRCSDVSKACAFKAPGSSSDEATERQVRTRTGLLGEDLFHRHGLA